MAQRLGYVSAHQFRNWTIEPSVINAHSISKCIALLSVVAIAHAALSQDAKVSEQYGAKRLDFAVEGFQGFVVLPPNASTTELIPWVWYAPTFIGVYPNDGHAWMTTQLLDAGFAIAGVDVGESYGSPKGVAAYSAFFDHVVSEYSLATKACLLPQSRGGLMLLNWAVENVSRVQCVAGIYTVCNLESYPGLARACGAYELSEEALRDTLESHNPIDRLKPLAEANTPLLFIHGDSDTVVPIEANAGELVARILSLGGNAQLITIPGKGHEEVPEFFQSKPFITFLLNQGDPSNQ